MERAPKVCEEKIVFTHIGVKPHALVEIWYGIVRMCQVNSVMEDDFSELGFINSIIHGPYWTTRVDFLLPILKYVHSILLPYKE